MEPVEPKRIFVRRGYRSKTMLEFIGSQFEDCKLCGTKHRMSFPLDPNTVYWNDNINDYSFTAPPPSVYTRGMHEFDLERSKVIPTCDCNCKSCEIARCRDKENLWSINLTPGLAQCCWIKTGLDQGVAQIRLTSRVGRSVFQPPKIRLSSKDLADREYYATPFPWASRKARDD